MPQTNITQKSQHFPHANHDDHVCINNSSINIHHRLEQARKICQQQGKRFTKLREQVYTLILQSNRPMGAYDLLNIMQQQQLEQSQPTNKKTKNIAPPTVYRSLEFLLDAGFIHQLTSINAFVACCHPREQHIAGFLICQQCQRVLECSNEAIQQLLTHTKEDIGFSVDSTMIEMTGTCQPCQLANLSTKQPKPQQGHQHDDL